MQHKHHRTRRVRKEGTRCSPTRPRPAPAPRCSWRSPGTPRSGRWNATPGPGPRRSPATSPSVTQPPADVDLADGGRNCRPAPGAGSDNPPAALGILQIPADNRGSGGDAALEADGTPARWFAPDFVEAHRRGYGNRPAQQRQDHGRAAQRYPALTPWGDVVQIAVRIVVPVLLGLAVLSIRGRAKR